MSAIKETQAIDGPTMDLLREWVSAHFPLGLEDGVFIRGLFVICDDAIRQAVVMERDRLLASLKRQAGSRQ